VATCDATVHPRLGRDEEAALAEFVDAFQDILDQDPQLFAIVEALLTIGDGPLAQQS
jgi:hypothetical protein